MDLGCSGGFFAYLSFGYPSSEAGKAKFTESGAYVF